jgi:hypothetical protein
MFSSDLFRIKVTLIQKVHTHNISHNSIYGLPKDALSSWQQVTKLSSEV